MLPCVHNTISDFIEVVDVTEFQGGHIGPIFLDRLECSGEEASLFECPHNEIHMCTHGDDVGIICHRKEIKCSYNHFKYSS